MQSLEGRGVDLHKVQLTKAELALWGMGTIKTLKTKRNNLKSSMHDKMEEGKDALQSTLHMQSGDDSWKRDILMGRQQPKREDAS